ncbi:MAG: deoxyuridine 5'-triphosphate nucleotidohydrolase, partial [Chloroflexi bacterium]|nr:deoxyuridine 5'-triphosphate nucleotidohydrolase [Chloroflexota bacterium]
MLAGDEIRALRIVQSSPDHDLAVQPNGIDLSIDAVWRFAAAGRLGRTNDERVLPARDELAFDAAGWLDLPAATYGVRYGELVSLPNDCGGLCFPRSSLLR